MTEPLRIAHQDRWLIVIDKPSGLATQSTRDGQDSLYELLKATHPYVGLHHRLDLPSSGLVLFTLSEAVNAAIAAGFRDHTIHRGYRAIPIRRRDRGMLGSPLEGRSARTDVQILGRGGGMSAAELVLFTGRTHQVRQHAALAGTPVVGDRRYGAEAGRAWHRLALHARTLSLSHPVTGDPLHLQAELPEDLAPLWRMAGGT